MLPDTTRPRPHYGVRLMRGFLHLASNLFGGIRLALLLPAPRRLFHVDLNQLVLLILLDMVVDIVTDYLGAGPGARFWPAGLGTHGFAYLTLFMAAYLVARLARAPALVPALMVMLLAGGLVLDVPEILANALWPLTGTSYLTFYHGWVIGVFCWTALIGVRALRVLLPQRRWPVSLLGALLVLGVLAPQSFGVTTPFWYTPPPQEAAESERTLDIEQTYAAQPGLLAAALDGVAPHGAGAAQLYFLGFAGYATQDVFLKEARSARRLFDTKFGTAGRSLLLANNPATVALLPVASVTNLGMALDGIGAKMDRDRDVLFLFLTSHGSRGELAVEFDPLGLDGLMADKLRALLDHAGIKWRVIVISSCYSGSFIEPLQNETSLVMTASRKDRTSFGCAAENDFTYFGEAYIGKALPAAGSFVAAFDQAKAAIAEREAAEKLVPSEPQIFIGEAIRAKLAQLDAGTGTSGVPAPAAP